ncbi:MAG: hypothetical protein P1U90_02180 [Akkermansiaceae bacterium]|nr:hypothetical protein [Akkermansiaceae bacterium]
MLEFGSGDFSLTGRLESEGDSGEGHFSRNTSRLMVKAGESAVVDFDENVPLRFGANLNSAGIRPTGDLRNEGLIIAEDLNVIGSGVLTNDGIIRVERLLRLSSTSGTETGFVSNLGIVDLTQDTSNSIRMRAGGVFTNETGGVVLLDEVGILGENGVTTPEFVNRGVLRAPNGGGVRVFFEQSGSPDALVESEQGTLSFTRDARFESGVLRSRNRILFSEDVILGDVGVELVNGGELLFQGTTAGSTADTYILGSDLEPTGDGVVRFTGGKLVPESGNGSLAINAGGNTRFVQSGGEVGQPGGTLGNRGVFEQTLGLVQGSFVNRGEFSSRGDIEGEFTNLGQFDLITGRIGGQYTNGELASPALGMMTVSGAARLVDDAVLTNLNEILITGSLGLENRAQLNLQRGRVVVDSSGSIAGVPGAADHELSVGADGELIWNTGGSVTVDRVTLNGGKLKARAGSFVNLVPDQLTLNGGSIEVEEGGRFVLRGAPGGTGPTRLVADGELTFDLINTSVPAAVTVPVGGEVTGSGSVEGLLTVDGALNPGGSLEIDGSLTQSDTSTTTIDVSINGADQVVVEGAVALDGALNLNVSALSPLAPGQNLTLISGTSVTGTFDQVTGLQSPALSVGQSLEIVYLPTKVELALTATATNFQTWSEGVFNAAQLADQSISGPHADPDEDGVSNIFEFIGGTSPTIDGDVFSFTFELVPSSTPGEVNTRYTIPVSPGRIGFDIEVLSLGDLSNPNDDQVVPHTGIFNLIDSILILGSDQSAVAGTEFQRLRATLR